MLDVSGPGMFVHYQVVPGAYHAMHPAHNSSQYAMTPYGLAPSHGIFFLPRPSNWFGIKTILIRLGKLIAAFFYAPEFIRQKLMEDEPTKVFFKNLHCLCEKLKDKYDKNRELYQLLEKIITEDREPFIEEDFKSVDEFFVEFQKRFPNVIGDKNKFNCLLTMNAWKQLKRYQVHVADILKDKKLDQYLEAVMLHLEYIRDFLKFSKILSAEDVAAWLNQPSSSNDSKANTLLMRILTRTATLQSARDKIDKKVETMKIQDIPTAIFQPQGPGTPQTPATDEHKNP